MLRKSVRIAALFAVVLSVAAVPGFSITKDFNQSYPLETGGSFELQNVNGAVEVQGWDRNEVEIHAVEYTVHVPFGAHVGHVGTVNGTLRIAGVPDVDDLHTVNGDIEVYGAGG